MTRVDHHAPPNPTPGPDSGVLARHLLAEYYGCDVDLLDSVEGLKPLLVGAAEAARTTVLNVHLHKFQPQGVSGVVILAESHLAVHTWPEFGFASIELYVCGEDADPAAGHAYLEEHLRPSHTKIQTVSRGSMELVRRFPPPAPKPSLAEVAEN